MTSLNNEPTEQVLDLDNDGLDDRLHRGSHQPKSVQDVLNRIDKMHMEDLPEHILQKMLANMQSELNQIVEQAKEVERIVHKEVVQGNYQIVSTTRKELLMLKREHRQIEELQQSLLVLIQETRLRLNMEEKIGSKGVIIMNWVSIILTTLVLGLMFIDLSSPSQTGWLSTWNIFYIDSACCVYFLWEFFFQYRAADDKKWFFRNHWIDLLTAIPVPPIEGARFVRFGRTVRFARLIRVLRLFRVFRVLKTLVFLSRTLRYMQDLMDLKTMQRSFTLAIFIIVTGGTFIMMLEPPTQTEGIATIGKSMWWSFATVVTGGFADLYNPQSVAGQSLTAFLVLSGMILVGVFTATLTSLYVGDESSEMEKIQREMFLSVQQLQAEITELKQRLPVDEPSTEKS